MDMPQAQYLDEQLENQINWYDNKSNRNQKIYKWSKRTELITAALIPLLAGFITIYLPPFTIGSLGAAIAVIEGILKLKLGELKFL